MTTLQNEQDALNAVKDFDLDAWLDEIEPPHRRQTVNTRGDLLARFAELRSAREAELRALIALEQELPEADPAETIGIDPNAEARSEFDAARARIAAFDEEMREIERTYAANKATFTFKALDPAERAAITAQYVGDGESGGMQLSEQTLRLFLASVTSIAITRDGQETSTTADSWNPELLTRFFAKIGDGQTGLLWDAYIGLGMQEVTPPFSHASWSGATTSTS